MDMYGFYTGQTFDAYKYMGAHLTPSGVVFRVFAPNAQAVSLVLNGQEMPMGSVYDGNFYEIKVENASVGDLYEYRVYTRDGGSTNHCDPYGFYMELRPAHKSVVCNLNAYRFNDGTWMKGRGDTLNKPLNIYELHLGSWHRKDDGSWYRYEELADLLVPYLKESGYNYVEFLPVSEHPADESWGYQNTGYFAPTSRYGKPEGLKKLIDTLHCNNIGVILDFVPVHFALDNYGLARFDGTALYEYPRHDVGVSEWGSRNFMHSRGEVRSFLQSAANYWLTEYHIDGLRMDAISRIIYWQGDEQRGENGNAVDFIKVMNKGLKERHPGCILIAEDSTNYPNVTLEVDKGGLGFDYKWDMGWMHDTLAYFQAPPETRSELYHKLTFSMMYFHSERYLLPFSHDEVVHGKATILQKMSGDYKQKFPQTRALYLYMMVHPGKKLNFMGNEIGQIREWDKGREQDWNLRKYPAHDSFYIFMSELNHLYLTQPAFYERDYDRDGFAWLDCHQEQKCVYVLERRSRTQRLIAVFNLSDRGQEYFLPERELIKLLIHTDWKRFGGNTVETDCVGSLNGEATHITLPPYSGLLLEVYGHSYLNCAS